MKRVLLLLQRGFLRLVLPLLAAVVIGLLLMTAAYLVPTELMEENLRKSAMLFEAENLYPNKYEWCSSMLDNYTDSLMMLLASTKTEEPPLSQAAGVPVNAITQEPIPEYILIRHYVYDQPFDSVWHIARYWHGYNLFLKPALCMMDYETMRLVNLILQIAASLCVCVMMWLKNCRRLILPYLIAYLFLMPTVLGSSLQFSTSYYMMCAGMIGTLWTKRTPGRVLTAFVLIGAGTSYFDYLTYPLITFGMPAAALCYLAAGEGGWMRTVKLLFCAGAAWLIGYLGMWASKWLITALVTGEDAVAEAMGHVWFRVSDGNTPEGTAYPLLETWRLNLEFFFRTPAVWALPAYAALLPLLRWKHLKAKEIKPGLPNLIFCLVLALGPLAWYAAVRNHSYIHYWFTNKALAAAVFAILTACVLATGREKRHSASDRKAV